MRWFKRKDGSVFGKISPSKRQVEAYKKDGFKECDQKGNALKKASKKGKK